MEQILLAHFKEEATREAMRAGRSTKLVIDFGHRVLTGLHSGRDLGDCPLGPQARELMRCANLFSNGPSRTRVVMDVSTHPREHQKIWGGPGTVLPGHQPDR